MDTIFALASARGRAGVSVVRISGQCAHAAVAALTTTLPEPRRMGLRRLSWQGEVIDEALVVVFAEGSSFTGEPMAELNVHGSLAVVSKVLRVLSEQPGLRPAEAGEFTRRALENGRLDLSQVEGLADLIDSETESQRMQALRVMSGELGRRAEAWRSRLLRAAALVEATIDFADEEVPLDVSPEVLSIVNDLMAEFRSELAGAGAAERVRDGFEVAILGVPNAGKSTLLNALAGREAAITSEVAGTTRDVIEVRMEIGGLPVTLLDTAGLRDAQDKVEQIGISRALERARLSDLRVFLLSGPADELPISPEPADIVVQGKADLTDDPVAVSGLTGQGLDRLVSAISAVLTQRAAGAGLLIRERQRIALQKACDALGAARHHLDISSGPAELAALELRSATRALEVLVGRIDVENLLGEIFSSFCIGK
ncbi:tRNA uridine-5-carboxymethylaminomethyl(34) synthesis GTPase MnmE [Paracoccaceae bacterium]